ncbi:hypothetical protein Lal_00016626 [Lupinus albus]|nr:hypothetical protein Lal_00016626 [Lupinus albus]
MDTNFFIPQKPYIFCKYLDIYDLDLFSVLNVLKESIREESNAALEILNYIKKILLTIQGTVATAERSFSKIKK